MKKALLILFAAWCSTCLAYTPGMVGELYVTNTVEHEAGRSYRIDGHFTDPTLLSRTAEDVEVGHGIFSQDPEARVELWNITSIVSAASAGQLSVDVERAESGASSNAPAVGVMAMVCAFTNNIPLPSDSLVAGVSAYLAMGARNYALEQLALLSLQAGDTGTWTNLSEYNNDLGSIGVDTNASYVYADGTTQTFYRAYVTDAIKLGTNDWATNWPSEGPQGPEGPQGIQGVQGIRGPTGPQGVQGVQGVAGANGLDGFTPEIYVSWTSNGAPGTMASVVNYGNATNAQLGFTIPVGDTGATGAKGDTGDTGATPEIYVSWTSNSVYGEDAVVTNTGSETNVQLGFIIPAGPQGEQGIQGPTGETGAAFSLNSVTGSAWITAGTNVSGVRVEETNIYVDATDTGATNIQAGASDSYDAETRTLSWNTNAAGGGSAGTITNILSTDSSVAITDPGGPQPDLSVTNYVAGFVPTNFITDSNTSATIVIGLNTNSPVQLNYTHYNLPMPDLGVRIGQFYKGPFATGNPQGPIIRFYNILDSGAFQAPEYTIAYFDGAGDVVSGAGAGLYLCRRGSATYYQGVLSIHQDHVSLGYNAYFDARGNAMTNVGTIYATNGAFDGTLTLGGNAVLTNAVTEYGTTDSTAYRGDWGGAVSNTAAAALSTNGGTMGGDLNMNANSITNVGNVEVWTNGSTGSALLRRDGTLAMTGDLDVGGNDITNAGTVTTTNLTIKGGSPTVGTAWRSTGTDGQGEWSTNTPGWSVYVGSPVAIPHNSLTVLGYNTFYSSNSVVLDAVNYRVTPQIAGRYVITANPYCLGPSSDIGQWAFLGIYKNGTRIACSHFTAYSTSAGGDYRLSLPAISEADGVDDYFDVRIFTQFNLPITNRASGAAFFFDGRFIGK